MGSLLAKPQSEPEAEPICIPDNISRESNSADSMDSDDIEAAALTYYNIGCMIKQIQRCLKE